MPRVASLSIFQCPFATICQAWKLDKPIMGVVLKYTTTMASFSVETAKEFKVPVFNFIVASKKDCH
jgi:hypothetical protein